MADNEQAQARSARMTFAFYARVARDAPAHVAGRQRLAAKEWLRERGWHIVSEYIDTTPRATPWAERPQARALLRACARPAPAITAVVAGDAAQAFGPDHLRPAIALLGQCGARLWAPEFGGAADISNELHRLIIGVLEGIASSGAGEPGSLRPRPGGAARACLPGAAPQERR
jgi:Resolvase, N terminal domain